MVQKVQDSVSMDANSSNSNKSYLRILPLWGVGCLLMLLSTLACTSEETRQPHKSPTTDSIPFMHSVGVSTLISDSGVIRYHLVAEEWDIYTLDNQAATWKFKKGMLMLRLDEKLDVDLYVQADTAYLHHQNTWELRGRVRIRNVQGTRFNTEELFWDLNKHEMWNHAHMTIITPERTLTGTEFRSNEQMTRYSVANSQGDFPMSDADGSNPNPQEDSLATPSRTAPTQQQPVQIQSHKENATPKITLPPAPTKYDFKK